MQNSNATDATATTATDATADATTTEKPAFVHPQADVSRAEYAGLSSYINSGRKLNVGIGVQKYGKRKAAAFTPRMLGCIAAMRKAYGADQFTLRGFDNAQLAIFINSGVIVNVRGGERIERDGIAYLTDGANPATGKLAKAYADDATKPATA